MEQFIQQEITLSEDFDVIYYGKDTTFSNFTKVPIKMVVWFDSSTCGACQAGKMYEWNNITGYADSLAQWFSVIYLFSPQKEDITKVQTSLMSYRFDYPIFIDQNATFIKQNKLPKNRQLHSFLLDRDNKVVMVGSPLHNPPLWALYKKTIEKMIANNGLLP